MLFQPKNSRKDNTFCGIAQNLVALLNLECFFNILNPI